MDVIGILMKINKMHAAFCVCTFRTVGKLACGRWLLCLYGVCIGVLSWHWKRLSAAFLLRLSLGVGNVEFYTL